MNPCRASDVGRLVVTANSALNGASIPDDAVSLVIHNPSYAALLIRWGSTPVDSSDRRGGYDLAIPGPSLAAIPIPKDASQLCAAWLTPDIPYLAPPDYVPVVDVSGADTILIQATPNNQGVFIGLLNGAPLPLVNTGT